MSSGHNWRNTLSDFASVSGVLAGFCVTFIALILGGPVADISIGSSQITFGQVAVLFFGLSAGFLISATEFFLHAKELDVFSIPDRYWQLIKDGIKDQKKDVTVFEDEQTRLCRRNERRGRRCYNIAVFVIFGGLFFAIAPYSLPVAITVSGFGITLELWQLIK